MRRISTTTGAEIVLDGDLLAIMEALYREVTAKRALERSFEDMVREIHHLIAQMDDSASRIDSRTCDISARRRPGGYVPAGRFVFTRSPSYMPRTDSNGPVITRSPSFSPESTSR